MLTMSAPNTELNVVSRQPTRQLVAWETIRHAAGLVSRVADFAQKLILADLAYDLVSAARAQGFPEHAEASRALPVASQADLLAQLDQLAAGRDPIATIAHKARLQLRLKPPTAASLSRRCPVPARPVAIASNDRGGLREQPVDPWTDRAGIALMLHNNLNGEYTTMELLAECSFEHPDLPLAIHERLLRQASDEARHARLFESAMADLDYVYGDFGVYTASYELCHEFTGVTPGSKHELANRLLVRCSYQEALSLDDLLWQITIRDELGQPHLVQLFEEVLADEIHHVRNGHGIATSLCESLGLDPMTERALAHDRFVTAEQSRHEAWLADNWQTVLMTEEPTPVTPPQARFRNHRDRHRAGLGLLELQQELCWDN